MMKRKIIAWLILGFVLMPLVTSAQPWEPWPDLNGSPNCGQIDTFSQLVACAVDRVLNPLIFLLIGAALVYFLLGVLKYMRQADNANARQDAVKMIWFGVIALFVMVSVWGLVNVVINSFQLDTTRPPLPDFSR